MLSITVLYSSALAKPYFLATASSCASTLGSGLASCDSLLVIASMSFSAAITPSICLSVSAICFIGGSCWLGGGAAWAGAGAILFCAAAPPADIAAIDAARQAILNMVVTGRSSARMGSLLKRLGGGRSLRAILRTNFGM